MNPEKRIVPVITCEHAGNRIPTAYKSLFYGAESALKSHRGWDPGAETLARKIAWEMGVEPHLFPFSRLLIEPNRSAVHPKLFSEYSNQLTFSEKKKLIKQYYLPYRMCITDEVLENLQVGKCVLHLSVHTFTPELSNQLRNFDIGLLYDPKRKNEKQVSFRLKKLISNHLPEFKVRMNRPYKGVSDGLTTMLRGKTGTDKYIGIEIEVNQKHTINPLKWQEICRKMAAAAKGLIC